MSIVDLRGVTESKPLGAIPPGKYVATVKEAKVEDTLSGSGKKLVCRLKIITGEHKDRELTHSFNIVNKSPDAQRIGLSQLKALMTALGAGEVLETVDQITGKPVTVALKNEKADDGNTYSRVHYFEKTEFKAQTEDVIPF